MPPPAVQPTAANHVKFEADHVKWTTVPGVGEIPGQVVHRSGISAPWILNGCGTGTRISASGMAMPAPIDSRIAANSFRVNKTRVPDVEPPILRPSDKTRGSSPRFERGPSTLLPLPAGEQDAQPHPKPSSERHHVTNIPAWRGEGVTTRLLAFGSSLLAVELTLSAEVAKWFAAFDAHRESLLEANQAGLRQLEGAFCRRAVSSPIIHHRSAGSRFHHPARPRGRPGHP